MAATGQLSAASCTPIFCASGIGSTVTRRLAAVQLEHLRAQPAHSPHWMHAFSNTIACMEHTSF